MAYESNLFEKVEYLRSKAAISYEEAVNLLERYDEDMTRILIELERSGRLREEAGAWAGEDYEEPQHCHGRKHRRHAAGFLTVMLKHRLEITRGDKSLVNLPLICYAALIFAPHVWIPLVIVLFVTGCRVHHWKEPGVVREQDVEEFASKAAKNIRVTVDNISKGFVAKEQPSEDEGSEDEGEITIE